MKVRLIRPMKVMHYPGEIVEISPSEALLILGTGSAEPVDQSLETPEKPKTKATKK